MWQTYPNNPDYEVSDDGRVRKTSTHYVLRANIAKKRLFYGIFIF